MMCATATHLNADLRKMPPAHSEIPGEYLAEARSVIKAVFS